MSLPDPARPARAREIEALILDLVRSPDQVAVGRIEALGPEEWKFVISLAHEHRFGPYLVHALAARSHLDLPAELLAIRDRSALRALRIARECVHIHDMLAAAGIAHIFLKGVALAFRDYPHAWMRPMRDIDVIIEPKRLEDAHALLHARGGSIETFAHVPVERTVDGKHLPPIQSPNRVLPVELHYRLISPKVSLTPEALRFAEREVWKAPQSVTVGGAKLPIPSTELLLAHLIIHGMLDHELNNGPLFIRDIVYLLQRNELDRGRWSGILDRTGLRRAVKLAASILPSESGRELLDGAEPSDALGDDVIRSLMLQPALHRSKLKLLATLSDTSLRDRVTLAFRKLFLNRSGLKSRWLAEGGTAGEEPSNIAVFWLWSLWAKLCQFFRDRSEAERRALRNLREFRRELDRRSIDE